MKDGDSDGTSVACHIRWLNDQMCCTTQLPTRGGGRVSIAVLTEPKLSPFTKVSFRSTALMIDAMSCRTVP